MHTVCGSVVGRHCFFNAQSTVSVIISGRNTIIIVSIQKSVFSQFETVCSLCFERFWRNMKYAMTREVEMSRLEAQAGSRQNMLCKAMFLLQAGNL